MTVKEYRELQIFDITNKVESERVNKIVCSVKKTERFAKVCWK